MHPQRSTPRNFPAAILLLVLPCLFVSAHVSLGRHIAKEFTSAVSTPPGWRRGNEATKTEKMTLHIALTQSNTDRLEEIFWAVSDPQNKEYGKYLSIEDLTQLIAPSEEALARVHKWLMTAGVFPANSREDFQRALTPNRDFLTITVSVETAEQLLKTKFYNYHHASSATTLIRSPGPYFVPELVANDIDFIGGVVRLPKTLRAVSPVSKKAPMQGGVTPQVIKQLFNIPPNTYGTNGSNSQAVAQFLGQFYDANDLAQFQQTFNLPSQTPTQVYGPNNATEPGIEAMLDIEYIMAIAPRVPTWFVSTGGFDNNGQETFLEWIVNMSSLANSPLVHSVSYGDYENTVSFSYAKRVNLEFQKFGARGRSILFASGDDGVGCDSSCSVFVPNFPATSPYVTAVGGVYYDGQSQTADSISSGGFSNYFGMPNYQKTAVQNYLTQNANNLPPQSFWNASGRAFPDVASISENVMIVYQGQEMGVAGTSCAAPVFSAIVSLINDARLNAKKPAMGFLNMFLYQTYAQFSGIFTDITSGSNSDGCCNGFTAATGWDPITGLGTPNFKQLLKYAMAKSGK